MYCLRLRSCAPPVVPTQYEFVHRVGSFRVSAGNSWRRKREERPLITFTSRWMPNGGSTLTVPLHLIGQDFPFLDLGLMFLAHLPDDCLQAGFEGLHQNLPPIFRTPNHMGVASGEYVPVAFAGLDHMFQYTAECSLRSRADFLTCIAPVPLPPQRNAPFIPMAEAQGLSGAAFGNGSR